MDDLEEELPRPRVENEDSSVDGLRGKITLEGLVDGHAVNVAVVHEPDDLVREQLAVVLTRQVRFGWLRADRKGRGTKQKMREERQQGIGVIQLGHRV